MSYKIDDKDTNWRIFERYGQYLRLEKGCTVNTIESYRFDLDKFRAFLKADNIDLLDVKADDLRAFLAGLHDVGIHPRSQARILSGLRSFYRFLLLEEYISIDPTELIESPRLGQHLPDVLTVGEIDMLIDAVDMEKVEGQRDRAILEMLYSCGLRVSELCNLCLSDVHVADGFIRVKGKGQKERLVPVSSKSQEELELYLEERKTIIPKRGHTDYVFLSYRRRTKLSRITVFHIVRVLVETVGISKTISPHTFRHSFATHMLEGGANLRAIQCMLGHESIATTEIYTHIDRSRLRQEIIEHHPRNIKYGERSSD